VDSIKRKNKKMKQIYLILFFSLIAKFNGQTITQSFNEPVIGDIDKSYRLDTAAYTSGLPVATTGSNCTWNYTNLGGAFPLVVDSFVAPSAAVSASAYPSASFAQRRNFLYTFYKSISSPQQTELLGAYSPSLSLTFTNSAIIATYPVGYGYNLTDPVSGSFKYNTTNGACNGNITITADGVGTINLPTATFLNVICLKSVEILTLSIGVFPFGTFNQTIYNYYAPGKKFPVLNINYTTYQIIGGGTPTVTAFVYGSNNYFTVAGLNESSLTKENYKIFPNPFHDQLTISTSNGFAENEYLLYDNNGKLLLQTKSLSGTETGIFLPGIYFLEILNKSGSFRKKVIKE